MCLQCLSGGPLSEEEKAGKYGQAYGEFANLEESTYMISMCQAPCAEPLCWCTTMLCFCPVQVFMRHKALNHIEPGSGWSNYRCCQGYFGCCCCGAPDLGESNCPLPCMCLEACCCPGMAVSATSIVIREHYNLGLDEDDVRLIRCNNCLQLCALCIGIISIFTESETDDEVAYVIDWIADCVFCIVSGCMTAQTYHEIKERDNGPPEPGSLAMHRF
mmetsp:Transcript_12361/g.28624  ORF Transcript_12361/g.28624 Transcript_12361/m.28624 type:complete len:217 (-) Transcript_12361:289-939(-)